MPVFVQVIYGDTDSIMVATGAQDLQAAGQLAGRIKREVNKRYRLLEIEEDGLFKRMLLLKKKKYAALKLVREPDGSWSEVRPSLPSFLSLLPGILRHACCSAAVCVCLCMHEPV